MKLFGDRTIRERITKLSEYISFCWAFLYSVSKDWKITKEEINTNSHGYARGGASCITISLRGYMWRSCRLFKVSLQRKSYGVNIEIKDLVVGIFTFNSFKEVPFIIYF